MTLSWGKETADALSPPAAKREKMSSGLLQALKAVERCQFISSVSPSITALKENEAGDISSPVVAVHTSFCRIYTSNIIAYPRIQTGLNGRRDTHQAEDTHLTCARGDNGRVALVCVDSGFTGAVSRPEFGLSWRPCPSIA